MVWTLKNKEIDIFELAKSVDTKSYIESFYLVEFNTNNFATCPFCGSDKTKAFSYEPKRGIVKCFSCMPKALGVIDFVMQMEQKDSLSAAKKICNDMGLMFEDEGLSDEERTKRAALLQKKQQELIKQREEKEKQESIQRKKQQSITIKRIEKNAPKILETMLLERNKKKIESLFHWTNKFKAWYMDYVGWDEEQESVCIVNWSREKKKYFNIKYREKFVWDKETKDFDKTKRMPGKWISEFACVEHPFPIDYFSTHDDDRVVICFGEKDALNLLSLDINTLTLGGISNSFLPYKNLLKDKRIYIFPDNQLAEYLAAMSRYKELEAVAKEIFIVSFSHIDKTISQKYDISDFILDRHFEDKEDFFNAIGYSCFTLTNSFIEDVANIFYGEEKLLSRLESFRQDAQSKSFAQIEDEIVKVAKPVKSELDTEIDMCEIQLKALNEHPLLSEFKAFVGNKYDGESFVKTLDKAMQYKSHLFGQFRKQHEADVTKAFIRDAKASGHEVATYRSRLYFWTGSHYEEVEEKELRVFIFQKWMEAAKVNMKQQTPDFMNKVATGAFYGGNALERIKKQQNYRVINFNNGTGYLHANGKFVFKNAHLKEDGATSILSFGYEKNAKCPKWRRFLNDVLPDKIEQNALMEFIGYCFLNTHSYQKFLFLLGSGANGKSIVLNVIRKFFGKSTSNVDLQQLFSHEMIGIENKYINIGSEINPRGLNDGQLENLKKLTAGEPTQLNPKNSSPYDISSSEIPKFIFSGNSKPRGNLDDGLFRRMLLLKFNKVISKKERIQSLEERFYDELSGIFNLALEGLNRLIRQGDFSLSRTMQEDLDEYKEESNPVLAYLNENVVLNKECMVARKFLYNHYKAWAEEKGHHKSSDRMFFSKVRDILREVTDEQPSYKGKHNEILGKRPRFVKGIELLPENIDLVKIDNVDVRIEDTNISVERKIPIIVLKGT